MSAEIQSISPSGHFQVLSEPWEPRMSLWVYPPQIVDTRTEELLFKVSDQNWSMEHAQWETEETVRLGMRKYPGDRRPNGLVITINCTRRTAEIEGRSFPLSHAESELEAALGLR